MISTCDSRTFCPVEGPVAGKGPSGIQSFLSTCLNLAIHCGRLNCVTATKPGGGYRPANAEFEARRRCTRWVNSIGLHRDSTIPAANRRGRRLRRHGFDQSAGVPDHAVHGRGRSVLFLAAEFGKTDSERPSAEASPNTLENQLLWRAELAGRSRQSGLVILRGGVGLTARVCERRSFQAAGFPATGIPNTVV